VGAVVTAGLVGLVGLMAVQGIKITSTLERTVATGVEATNIENAVLLMLESKCTCAQSGLHVPIDVNNPGSITLGTGTLFAAMSAGDSIGRFRDVSTLTFTEMKELQTLSVDRVEYWTSVILETTHERGQIKGPDTQAISIPLKVEVLDDGVDPPRIVACYSKSSLDCDFSR